MHHWSAKLSLSLFATSLCFQASVLCAAENSKLIARAESAAPSMLSKEATIVYRGAVLREGSNGWTCMPETLPDDNAPICNDATWMQMMQAVGSKAPYSASSVGISYMLQGDGGVSNADPYHPHPMKAEDYIKEGPHLMLIVPRALLEGLSDDPSNGGPYVMWGDTPYAHIMIPLQDR